MTCRSVPLESLHATNLDPAEIEAAAVHLSGCARCRERLRVMTGLRAVFRERPSAEQPLPAKKFDGLTLRLLAAALILAFLLPMIHRPWRSRPLGGAAFATTQAYPAFPLRTRSGVPEARRSEAFSAYRAGRYERAAALFGQSPENAEARFYEGVSCYFLGRTEKAVASLEAAARMDSAWREPALWYQANALLKAGRIEDAKRLLTKLSRLDGDFSAAGDRLLQRLEEAAAP